MPELLPKELWRGRPSCHLSTTISYYLVVLGTLFSAWRRLILEAQQRGLTTTGQSSCLSLQYSELLTQKAIFAAMARLPEYAIIVAGGSGTRMQQELPKQFIEVAGKPILMHTIERFYAYNPDVRLIVVLPEQQLDMWRQLCRKHSFTLFHMTVSGGATRFGSVKNGLDAVQGEALVAVHDGVRPFVNTATIKAAFEAAAAYGNAVVAISPKDSIRKLTLEGSQAVPRANYKLVQTPQCFKASILKRAYEQPEQEYFTDDASVVEQTGERIVLVEGNYRNIKITTPEDLLLAEAFADYNLQG